MLQLLALHSDGIRCAVCYVMLCNALCYMGVRYSQRACHVMDREGDRHECDMKGWTGCNGCRYTLTGSFDAEWIAHIYEPSILIQNAL